MILEPTNRIAEKLEHGFCQDQAQYIANHVYQPLKQNSDRLEKGIDHIYDALKKETQKRTENMKTILAAVQNLTASVGVEINELQEENKILKKQNEVLKQVLIESVGKDGIPGLQL